MNKTLPDLFYLLGFCKKITKQDGFQTSSQSNQPTSGFRNVKTGPDPSPTPQKLISRRLLSATGWRKALVIQYEELQIQSSNGNKKPRDPKKKKKIIHHTGYRNKEWTQPTFEILMLNTHNAHAHQEATKFKKKKGKHNFQYSSLQSLQNNKANLQRHEHKGVASNIIYDQNKIHLCCI